MNKFDYIIVGGGSSGCVLANRLSGNPGNNVLLIEAGPDTPPDDVPASIYAEGYLPDYFQESRYWTKLKAYRDEVNNLSPEEISRKLPAYRYEQARVMGGGSSVNGQVALRGIPSDYDSWANMGATGWSFDECLPYFRRLERDMDFDGPLHGREGPMAIRRTFPEDWAEFATAFRKTLEERGLPYADDCHATFGNGCFPFPKNNVYGRRITTAVGYLDSATRRRENLKIRSKTQLQELLFDGLRVKGVRVLTPDGAREEILAEEVILCSGALHTPAILMRAGIGPEGHLSQMGIAIRADSPGIGQNLQDHPLVGIGVHLKPEARLSNSVMNSFLVYTRFSSGMPGCPEGDMKMSLGNRFDQTKIGHQFGVVRIGPDKAFSRGMVQLNGPDPDTEPFVSFNLLSDERDLQRMFQGVRFAIEVLQSDPIRRVSYSVFAGAYTDWIRRLSNKSWISRLITHTGAMALDSHRLIRQGVMDFAMGDYDIKKMKTDDRELERFVRDTVLGNWHACGTVKMGDTSDPMTCVDTEGRVIGVEGLRVADASVIPSIPCANIHLTTIMIAEKMADSMVKRTHSTRAEIISN